VTTGRQSWQNAYDLDVNRIALIGAGSVDNIAYLLLIFNEFRIPCYTIFDGDKPIVDPNTLTGSHRDDVINKSKRKKNYLLFLISPFLETYSFSDRLLLKIILQFGKKF